MEDTNISVGGMLMELDVATELDLSEKMIDDDGAKHIAQSLQSNFTLTSLNLKSNQIGDFGARALAQSLQFNSTLTSLNLRCNKIDDIGALTQSLQFNSTLTSLNLRSNKISDNGLQDLPQSLNSTLTSLNLRWNEIGDKGAEVLSQLLQFNSTLTSLNLYGNNIGDNGAKSLAESLQFNSALTVLNLRGNYIGDNGAQALSQLIQFNSTITSLNLEWNTIGHNGAQAILQSLQFNSTLTSLNLENNKIGGTITTILWIVGMDKMTAISNLIDSNIQKTVKYFETLETINRDENKFTIQQYIQNNKMRMNQLHPIKGFTPLLYCLSRSLLACLEVLMENNAQIKNISFLMDSFNYAFSINEKCAVYLIQNCWKNRCSQCILLQLFDKSIQYKYFNLSVILLSQIRFEEINYSNYNDRVFQRLCEEKDRQPEASIIQTLKELLGSPTEIQPVLDSINIRKAQINEPDTNETSNLSQSTSLVNSKDQIIVLSNEIVTEQKVENQSLPSPPSYISCEIKDWTPQIVCEWAKSVGLSEKESKILESESIQGKNLISAEFFENDYLKLLKDCGLTLGGIITLRSELKKLIESQTKTSESLSMDVEFGNLDTTVFNCLSSCSSDFSDSLQDSLPFLDLSIFDFTKIPGHLNVEEQAIYLYTVEVAAPNQDKSIYKQLNCDLTDPSRNDESISKWKPFIGLLIKGLDSQDKWFPDPSSPVLYRGVDRNLVKDFRKKYFVGNVFTWYPFTSTTDNKKKATSFFNKKRKASECTLFIITKSLSGRVVFDISSRNEREVLFPPLTNFKIKKITEESTAMEIEIEQVPSEDVFGLEKTSG